MFPDLPPSPDFPRLELEILAYWKDRRIYERSLERRRGAPTFVFFEGPPTANGLPHPGHCLTRAIKDLFPRYRTMRGFYCQRKAGWDTHGLPVEVEVCKELGIHSKEEIEAFGVEPFIQRCQQSVWRYMKEWEQLTERIGFWIHLDEAYVTYHQSYVESVWWCLKNLFDRDLLYRGHKIVWWWAQGGTALSSHEVGLGYRQVADPSVYVLFPLVPRHDGEPPSHLLVWTTTPWTLPSNQFAAVHPDLEYVEVIDEELNGQVIVAANLLDTIREKVKRDLRVIHKYTGRDLVGREYLPPFDYYHRRLGEERAQPSGGASPVPVSWRVVEADFVTTDTGTGIVHLAPAFGEVDFQILLREQGSFQPGAGPELICAVGPDGRFTAEAPDYQGRWVKEADRDIVRDLRRRKVLYHQEQYLHDYPFCWRADQDPLIQYPRRSWFIRTTRYRERMLENNRQMRWMPPHIQTGRFGNFLEANVDWALSRERYWGTPLPIWVCEATGKMEAIASYDELCAKPDVDGQQVWQRAKQEHPQLPDDLKVHKPYIDAITYRSPFAPAARMRRVPDVIDCWFDSGAMPFAQWGYPHQGRDRFQQQFPADFISEAIDQTRGWFYSLLSISTLLFSEESPASDPSAGSPPARSADRAPVPYPHPFKNCIVLGLMLGEDGEKMSKQKRNYREPQQIFDRYGADALRWYFFANQPPWTSIRYNEQAIKDSIPEFLLRLWNVFGFFVIYANIDHFDPGARLGGKAEELSLDVLARGSGYRPAAQRSELDRWILSELAQTARIVVELMDAYDNFSACGKLHDFVDGLSNWYVRRSRERFWKGDLGDPDKLDAYWTLYECLLTVSKLIGPFTPFVAESIWGQLTSVFQGRAVESVHLCDYPVGNPDYEDHLLSERMQVLREIASLGRSARMDAKLKVRQPLSKVEVILADPRHRQWLQDHALLLRDELNVKQVEFTQQADEYISYQVHPNFKRLGPRVGRLMPQVKDALARADGAELMRQLQQQQAIVLEFSGEQVHLDAEDVQVRLQARPGWAAAQGPHCVVVLATELTAELIREGYVRDFVRLIAERRKELNCHYTDRIQVGVNTASVELQQAIAEYQAFIQEETLAVEVRLSPIAETAGVQVQVGDFPLELFVRVVSPRNTG